MYTIVNRTHTDRLAVRKEMTTPDPNHTLTMLYKVENSVTTRTAAETFPPTNLNSLRRQRNTIFALPPLFSMRQGRTAIRCLRRRTRLRSPYAIGQRLVAANEKYLDRRQLSLVIPGWLEFGCQSQIKIILWIPALPRSKRSHNACRQ